MEYVEISKVIDIELGKTPSRNNTDYWNGENTWITIADMTQKYIEESKEKNYIRYTFYELRIKYNLSEKEVDEFLKLARTYYENNDYKVF